MAFKGGFGVRCARVVRKKRCGSACVDHIVAIVHASIAAMCVDGLDVHLGVLGELVVLEMVRTGGTSDRGLVRVMYVVMTVGRWARF